MRRADREIKDKNELREVFQRADACHIALVDGADPYLVTLNYGFDWESELPVLFFHCANEGRKLDVIRRNPRACFSVDVDHELVPAGNGCSWGMKYKSVVGTGTFAIVKDPSERERGLQLLMTHYAGRTGFQFEEDIMAKTTVLKLTADGITGKKKA
ncbi:MAG: pyridoxamine 5'-phosphate oxidase family protein [Spirochaetales bacterium]|nr:pyridoxamine 5'-phosphate oxidase family protein [Spirochaetales bacterium]